MINLVVVHRSDGEIIKGTTGDFFQNKAFFHLEEKDSGTMKQIQVVDLKAIYFVKSFTGNADYNESCAVEQTGLGRKIEVHYNDGEVQIGYTQGYSPGRPGFFVVPCDPNSNNIRIFVVTAATKAVKFL